MKIQHAFLSSNKQSRLNPRAYYHVRGGKRNRTHRAEFFSSSRQTVKTEIGGVVSEPL